MSRFKTKDRLIMVTLQRAIPVAFLAVLITACQSSTPVASAPTRYLTIVRLQSRNYSIEISAGPRSPVYSITDSAGQLICDNLSLTDLRIAHPELFNLLAPALAPNATASAVSPIIFADDR
jgi:hypothetical protein